MGRGSAGRSPRILGITGPIGCGKTTVGDILLQLGADERIDADAVVHDLMWPGTPTTAEIALAFGDGVIRPDGSVDRAHLASLVFADPVELERLERIVHPAVRNAIQQRIEEARGRKGVVVVDAVKLLQSDLLELVDEVWVVTCAPDVQRDRLTGIRGMTPDAAAARQRAQPSFAHDRVTRVLDNSGSPTELHRQTAEAWRAFVAGSTTTRK